MNIEQVQALGEELIRYTAEIGEGKNFEINALEITAKIKLLNELIDKAIEEDNNDFHSLVSICYHYYRLMYA